MTSQASHQRSNTHDTMRINQDDQFKDWPQIYENQRARQIIFDKYQKEEDALRKRMYADELNRLIAFQKEQAALLKNNDNEDILRDNAMLVKLNEQDRQKALKTKHQTQDCLSQSISYVHEKQNRELFNKEVDANERVQRAITMKLEDEQMNELNRINKQVIKESWLKDYDSHHNYRLYRNQSEKDNDSQLSRNQLQMIIQQDTNRKIFQDKIRGGFKQNQTVLQHYDKVYADRNQLVVNREALIVGQVLQERQKQDQFELVKRQKKQQLQTDILTGLVQQMQYKQDTIQVQRDQKRNMKMEIDERNILIHESQYHEAQLKRQEKQIYANLLKQQIEDDAERKQNTNQMSEMERKINNRNINSTVALPGLAVTPNFDRKKQNDYLDYNLNRVRESNFLLHKKQGNLQSQNIFKNASVLSMTSNQL